MSLDRKKCGVFPLLFPGPDHFDRVPERGNRRSSYTQRGCDHRYFEVYRERHVHYGLYQGRMLRLVRALKGVGRPVMSLVRSYNVNDHHRA